MQIAACASAPFRRPLSPPPAAAPCHRPAPPHQQHRGVRHARPLEAQAREDADAEADQGEENRVAGGHALIVCATAAPLGAVRAAAADLCHCAPACAAAAPPLWSMLGLLVCLAVAARALAGGWVRAATGPGGARVLNARGGGRQWSPCFKEICDSGPRRTPPAAGDTPLTLGAAWSQPVAGRRDDGAIWPCDDTRSTAAVKAGASLWLLRAPTKICCERSGGPLLARQQRALRDAVGIARRAASDNEGLSMHATLTRCLSIFTPRMTFFIPRVSCLNGSYSLTVSQK